MIALRRIFISLTLLATIAGADASGTFVSAPGKSVNGNVAIAKTQTGQVLKLYNFRSSNGPDLKVYLATDKAASDFVSLGELKSFSGDQEYSVPDHVDLNNYSKVLIWCEQFSVLFGTADLSL